MPEHNPIIDHPAAPPPWLPQWPDLGAIDKMFSLGIRQYSRRLMFRANAVRLQWTALYLEIDIEQQRARWRQAGDHWRSNCSCGFPGGLCAHAYLAARLFTEVCNGHNWRQQKPPSPTATDAVPPPAGTDVALPPPRRQAPPARHHGKIDAEQFLEVELDFHHSGTDVAVRFYANSNGQRRLLRLQALLNEGLRVRKHTMPPRRWPAMDQEFLRWLVETLQQKPGALNVNMQMLKLSTANFQHWCDRWHDYPQRFIERSSQKAYHAGGEAKAHLEFHLRPVEDSIEIAAMIIAPDGKVYDFPTIFSMLAEGKKNIVIDGQLLSFTPPVPWELLLEVFSKKAPRMRRQHICEHLPHLLYGRLDLVKGPVIRHRQVKGKIRFEAKPDGADILLTITVNKMPLPLDGNATATALRRHGRCYEVVTQSSDELPTVRRLLAPLPLQQVDANKSLYRLAGSRENMLQLVELWRQLPAEVEHFAEPQLAALLQGATAPKAEVFLHSDANLHRAHLQWRVGDEVVAHAEMLQAMRSEHGVYRTRAGNWLHVDADQAKQQLSDMQGLGFDMAGRQLLQAPQARQLARQVSASTTAMVAESSRSLAQRLLSEPEPQLWPIPPALQRILRPYQLLGAEFMIDRCVHKVGAILADDMGLGKTLQVLTTFAAAVAAGETAPALVICPASVVAVWLDQVRQFCPELNAVAYRGDAELRRNLLLQPSVNLFVTNYALVRNDIEFLLNHEFSFVAVDEAQYIKNPASQVSVAIKRLRTDRPLALTGTPLENQLLDLWSLADFVAPGLFGNKEEFSERYDNIQGRQLLRTRLAPLLLRRSKHQVAPELPPRTEETLEIALEPLQQRFYDMVLAEARQNMHQHGAIDILAALTRLRQVCCHPQLVDENAPLQASAKVEVLRAMLEEVLGEGHSALVFSQFANMIRLLEKLLTAAGIPVLTLTGDTPMAEREQLVQKFQSSEQPYVFLISLKAGGTGLTLTNASYVFLYDPWWNPAVEQQAIDRTHRIGQVNPVFVYRLVSSGTVEEKVRQLQQEKAQLFQSMLDGEIDTPQRLSASDLQALLN